MNREFVRKVLGNEVANRVKEEPDGGFSVLITERQIQLLESTFAQEKGAVLMKSNSALFPEHKAKRSNENGQK